MNLNRYNLKRFFTALSWITILILIPTSAFALMIRNDDFSSNTLNDYAALSIYFTPHRNISGWSISNGKLHSTPGTHGMLAFEDSNGNVLATPNHFSIAYTYMPTVPETQPPYNQDHPGIAFDRNGSNARQLYLRSHSNQVVGSRTQNDIINFLTVLGTSGIAVHTAYDLVFEVNYLATTASVEIRPTSGGNIIHTAILSGTNFTQAFGSNTGGAFGINAFDSEGASYDNLVVMDLTAIPEPSVFYLLGIGAFLMLWAKKQSR